MPNTFKLADDFQGEVAVRLYPGATFRVYENEAGEVTGIVVYHETVDPDGTRRGHENDYALRPVGHHMDILQTARTG